MTHTPTPQSDGRVLCWECSEASGAAVPWPCMAVHDARIDALHGPGAAKAIDEAYADGSIFSDHEAGPS